jgi:polysaccharide biosynthesis protein VpsM
MNIKRHLIFLFVLLTFTMILPSSLLAQGGKIHIGNLKIIPGITAQLMHDDNIYLKNGTNEITQKKVSDWIHHIQPALLLNYTLPERGFVNLGYQGDWAFYRSEDNNNWKSNKFSGSLDYKAPGGLILAINDMHSISEDPYGSPDQYAIGRITRRWDNDLKTKIGFFFTERLRSFLYYNYYKQDYKDDADASQNYYINEFGVGIEAKFLPKTWGFLRYYYGKQVYDSDLFASNLRADSKSHKASLGLTWDAAEKISGELNFGYQWKSYDNDLTTTPGMTRGSKNTWIAATSVSYKPLETTNVTLNVSRALRDTAADTGEFFEDTGFGLSLRQTLLRKFTLNIGGMYSTNDYNTNDRKDKNYIFNAGVDYNIREWLTAGIGYSYKRKDSNAVENEYTDNQFIASVKVIY